MAGNLVTFCVAAILEIGGCFAFWSWLRRGSSPMLAFVGVASLIGFALALTRVDTAFAGRAYAAYGGIYIASSLLWLWAVEDQRPTRGDLIGSALAVSGTLWILLSALRSAPR
jgi:small multidrug resistance family-3 protein